MAKIADRKNCEEFFGNLAMGIFDVLGSIELRDRLSEGAVSVFQSTYHIHQMKENYKILLDSLL